MKKNMISLCALLLVGAAGTMTAGAQTARTLAVFVVGDNTISSSLTTQLRTNLTSGGRYTLTSVGTADKLTELQATYTAGGGSSINRDALATWGREKGISAICLVVDDKKGNDHLFSAQLIDTKDSKLEGRGSYVRTSVAAGDATRVALALSRQLEGPERVARKSVTSQQQWFEPEMVLVKGGTFTMGCVPARDGTCKSNELPARQVQLSSFYIGKYEMTTAQWNAVMKGHPLEKINPTEDQGPVSGIAWVHLDTAFLLRLNALTGRTTAATKYRLPTAAEWEYAARGCSGDGGTGVATCESFMYSGSNTVNDVAWTSSGRPVGQKKPNGLGIYDMSGNNWEWCNDLFSATYYSTLPESGVAVNPTGVTTGTTLRTQRGGGWYPTDNTTHRVAARQAACTANCYDGTTGFRLVLPAQ